MGGRYRKDYQRTPSPDPAHITAIGEFIMAYYE